MSAATKPVPASDFDEDDDPAVAFARPLTPKTSPDLYRPDSQEDRESGGQDVGESDEGGLPPALQRRMALSLHGRQSLDPGTMRPFNCKMAHGLKTVVGVFAAANGQKLQDLVAQALVEKMAREGWADVLREAGVDVPEA